MQIIGSRSGSVVRWNGLSTATAPATNTANGRRTKPRASQATDAAQMPTTTVNHNRCANGAEPPSVRTRLASDRSRRVDDTIQVEPVPANALDHSLVTPEMPATAGPVLPVAMNMPGRNHACGSTMPNNPAATTPRPPRIEERPASRRRRRSRSLGPRAIGPRVSGSSSTATSEPGISRSVTARCRLAD